MAKLAKPILTLTPEQTDVAIAKARYERSKAFHVSLHAFAARITKVIEGLTGGHGRPATS